MDSQTAERKQAAELSYWQKLYGELVGGAADPVDALMRVSCERTFPRYLQDLGLQVDSFAGKLVLEVACGPNGGLNWFEDCVAIGVDELIEPYQQIGYPLWRHRVRYVAGRSEALPVADASVDAVVMTNALDHVEDPALTVAEIRRALRTGGVFHLDANYQYKVTTCEPHQFSDESLGSMLEPHFDVVKVRELDRPEQRLRQALFRCRAI
ncbi:MAG TPA: class I SAM-dependent methyltransferase [Phycisphaerae bacterium]|nr:class I SAM-dependent methyltransferase [Phycisphaerae bacterium]